MLSEKIKDLMVGSSAIRSMFEEGKRLAAIHGAENVFDFSLGNPNVEPPKEVNEAIREIMSIENPNMVHGYMNNSGFEDVRKIIANYTNERFGTKVASQHIVMTNGAAGGLNIVFKTLLNPDDEILIFAPYFAEYKNYAKHYDAKIVIVPYEADTFQPDLNEMANCMTSKTKIVMVNSPNNPSGAVYTDETIAKMAEIIQEAEGKYGHSIFLLSDEPYRELVYDDILVPYLLGYHKNSMVCYSFSKTLSLPGERIGYLVVNPEIEAVEEMLMGLNVANRTLGFLNAPSLFQRVIGKIIGAKVDINYYKKNRDALYNHLTEVGFEVFKPDGAFYMLVKSPIEDDVQFCEDGKQFNLLMVPGKAFGCPGYVRLSYCLSFEKLVKSFTAFDQLIRLYQ